MGLKQEIDRKFRNRAFFQRLIEFVEGSPNSRDFISNINVYRKILPSKDPASLKETSADRHIAPISADDLPFILLDQINVRRDRYEFVHRLIFGNKITDYRNQAHFLLLSKFPGVESKRVSILVITSGVVGAELVTYTHYQSDRRNELVISNGLCCPTSQVVSLFGAY